MLSNSKDDLSQLLREKGYKITEQRKAVLEIVMEHDGEHLSSQEIYELVKRSIPMLVLQLFTGRFPYLKSLVMSIQSTSEMAARGTNCNAKANSTGTTILSVNAAAKLPK